MTAPPVLIFARMIVDDFAAPLDTYAAVLRAAGGIETSRRGGGAKLWTAGDPKGAEIELFARDRAMELLGEKPRSSEKIDTERA